MNWTSFCDVDKRHVTSYNSADDQNICRSTYARAVRHWQGKTACRGSCQRAARKLEYIDLATQLDDLKVPPGNRLHALEGDRKGQYSISVNDQWRICFRFLDGDAYDVEFCDYH